ncbi:hypothetical protein FOA52_013019 [Chlamydomonas sp. UWO 241]|nr:hypothetical protein FOA52_013019 [Chlamydomonas sp. UWO 241]
MSGAESIDSHLVRVPFEALKRAAKDRKAAVDEAAEAVAAAFGSGSARAANGGGGGDGDGDGDDDADAGALTAAHGTSAMETEGGGDAAARLDTLLTKLQGIKRKLSAVSEAEASHALRVRARLDFLAMVGPPPKTGVIAWNHKRLDLILTDYLLRGGFNATAASLTQRAPHLSDAQLTDFALFESSSKVVRALTERRDCGPALAWCSENRARLKRLKSKLEFKLRVQEFLELVSKERRLDAVAYARTHLAPWASTYMPELQRAFAALIFTRSTKCKPYADLFDASAWPELAQLFLRDVYRMHALPQASMLAVHMQAGLCALKTPQSYAASCSREDPLHLAEFQALARGLPFAKHVHSKLLCSVTREIMNDANPPMVLPNGYVYSARAVERLLEAGGGAKLTCPITKTEHSADELRRAFIV